MASRWRFALARTQNVFPFRRNWWLTLQFLTFNLMIMILARIIKLARGVRRCWSVCTVSLPFLVLLCRNSSNARQSDQLRPQSVRRRRVTCQIVLRSCSWEYAECYFVTQNVALRRFEHLRINTHALPGIARATLKFHDLAARWLHYESTRFALSARDDLSCVYENRGFRTHITHHINSSTEGWQYPSRGIELCFSSRPCLKTDRAIIKVSLILRFSCVCNNKVDPTTGTAPKPNDTVDFITEHRGLMIHLWVNKSPSSSKARWIRADWFPLFDNTPLPNAIIAAGKTIYTTIQSSWIFNRFLSSFFVLIGFSRCTFCRISEFYVKMSKVCRIF